MEFLFEVAVEVPPHRVREILMSLGLAGFPEADLALEAPGETGAVFFSVFEGEHRVLGSLDRTPSGARGYDEKRLPSTSPQAMSYNSRAGWSSLVARRAHNPKVVGSNPTPATKKPVSALAALTGFLLPPGGLSEKPGGSELRNKARNRQGVGLYWLNPLRYTWFITAAPRHLQRIFPGDQAPKSDDGTQGVSWIAPTLTRRMCLPRT
jgi:hypothetical protein